jgi:hypothetical protein
MEMKIEKQKKIWTRESVARLLNAFYVWDFRVLNELIEELTGRALVEVDKSIYELTEESLKDIAVTYIDTLRRIFILPAWIMKYLSGYIQDFFTAASDLLYSVLMKQIKDIDLIVDGFPALDDFFIPEPTDLTPAGGDKIKEKTKEAEIIRLKEAKRSLREWLGREADNAQYLQKKYKGDQAEYWRGERSALLRSRNKLDSYFGV